MSGNFIVVFKEGVTKELIDKYVEQLNNSGGAVGHRYDAVLNGFSATIPDHFLQSLQGDDLIEYIEPDGVVTTQFVEDIGS